MSLWRKHIGNAHTLLDLAVERQAVPTKVLDCLYDVIVEVTRAVMELERPEEGKYDERQRF